MLENGLQKMVEIEPKKRPQMPPKLGLQPTRVLNTIHLRDRNNTTLDSKSGNLKLDSLNLDIIFWVSFFDVLIIWKHIW